MYQITVQKQALFIVNQEPQEYNGGIDVHISLPLFQNHKIVNLAK